MPLRRRKVFHMLSYWDVKGLIKSYISPATWEKLRQSLRWVHRYNHLLPHHLVVNHPPMLHNIELTNACPMHCIACPRPTAMTRSVGFMEIDFFKKIIDELLAAWSPATPPKDYRIAMFDWGESLLHPKFDEAMRYIRENGLSCYISCNPLLLTEERAQRLFAAEPAEVWMMMDGIDDESFFRTRGVKNAYADSLKNAIRAFEIKNAVSPRTDLQIIAIEFPAFTDITDRIEKYWREEHGIHIVRRLYAPYGDLNDGLPDKPKDDVYFCRICRYPWRDLAVLWDGTVTPCCIDYDSLYPLGNLKEKSLIEIWNGESMRALRAELRSGNVTNPLCRRCQSTYRRPANAEKA